MWRVNVPNHIKVAVTKLPRRDADLLFAALKAMREDPLGGELYALGSDSYYRPVDGYLVFFDLVPSEHVVNVTAVERPH